MDTRIFTYVSIVSQNISATTKANQRGVVHKVKHWLIAMYAPVGNPLSIRVVREERDSFALKASPREVFFSREPDGNQCQCITLQNMSQRRLAIKVAFAERAFQARGHYCVLDAGCSMEVKIERLSTNIVPGPMVTDRLIFYYAPMDHCERCAMNPFQCRSTFRGELIIINYCD
uniref:MSP domain-containing protein n=1 Tax=Trichuris muris TaxID=70415 RepID=A0A5S6QGH2_TRIMR